MCVTRSLKEIHFQHWVASALPSLSLTLFSCFQCFGSLLPLFSFQHPTAIESKGCSCLGVGEQKTQVKVSQPRSANAPTIKKRGPELRGYPSKLLSAKHGSRVRHAQAVLRVLDQKQETSTRFKMEGERFSRPEGLGLAFPRHDSLSNFKPRSFFDLRVRVSVHYCCWYMAQPREATLAVLHPWQRQQAVINHRHAVVSCLGSFARCRYVCLEHLLSRARPVNQAPAGTSAVPSLNSRTAAGLL